MHFMSKCLAVGMQNAVEIEAGRQIEAGLGRIHILIRTCAWAVSSFPSASLSAGQARQIMPSSDSRYLIHR